MFGILDIISTFLFLVDLFEISLCPDWTVEIDGRAYTIQIP